VETSASLPSKRELLSFQESWLRRAGFAALGGAFLIAASIVYQRAGLDLPDSSSDADQLVFAHAHSGRLVLSSIIQALGFCLFTPALYVLFRAAAGRAERMRTAFLALVVLGPFAFGIGLAVSAAGTANSADDFVSKEPAVSQQAREQATTAEQQPKKNATTTTTTTGGTTTTTTAPAVKTPDQAADDARENLADDTNKHEALLIGGGIVSTIGVLALVFGMIYTSIWCMRVGLLSRFWGALGIAFGLFLVIPIFPPVPGLVLWFAAIGLMFLGVWPRPLPPAWAAGEAMPWMPADQDIGPPPEGGPPGTVEGSGREIVEPPLPENGASAEEPEETQGQRRKKRKRRK
jgi:MFS family permease